MAEITWVSVLLFCPMRTVALGGALPSGRKVRVMRAAVPERGRSGG
jgi:hypothetical protein